VNIKEKTLEQILQESMDIHTWIFRQLDGVPLPKTRRLLLAISAFDVVFEHFTGITVLIEKKVNGSAFALVRSIFETFVRAVWLKDCASDEELAAFERDERGRNFDLILAKIEELDAFKSGTLSDLKKQAWSAMNSYTHGGIHQVARRVKGNAIDPNYLDGEIIEVLRMGQMFALLAFIQIVLVAGREDLEQLGIQKLYELELFVKK
jgi:hypothetical protein